MSDLNDALKPLSDLGGDFPFSEKSMEQLKSLVGEKNSRPDVSGYMQFHEIQNSLNVAVNYADDQTAEKIFELTSKLMTSASPALRETRGEHYKENDVDEGLIEKNQDFLNNLEVIKEIAKLYDASKHPDDSYNDVSYNSWIINALANVLVYEHKFGQDIPQQSSLPNMHTDEQKQEAVLGERGKNNWVQRVTVAGKGIDLNLN